MEDHQEIATKIVMQPFQSCDHKLHPYQEKGKTGPCQHKSKQLNRDPVSPKCPLVQAVAHLVDEVAKPDCDNNNSKETTRTD